MTNKKKISNRFFHQHKKLSGCSLKLKGLKREVVQPDYKSDDKIYDVYEEAKKQAFIKPSLEETMKIEDTVMKFDQFKEYKQERVKSPAVAYLKEFNDPEGFKRAFIMSEILKRKF